MMKELERKQKIRRVMYSVPSIILLLAVTFVLARGAIRVMNKERDSAEQARILEEKEGALILRERELEEGIAYLKTEEGIKDEIKERFSVTQEGEHVAVIIDDKRASSSADASAWSWYKKLWAVIMRKK